MSQHWTNEQLLHRLYADGLDGAGPTDVSSAEG